MTPHKRTSPIVATPRRAPPSAERIHVTTRRQAEEALWQAQALNQQILAMAPSLVYIYDLDAKQNRFANRSLAGVLGYPPAQAASVGSVFLPADVHPDDAAILREKLAWVAAAADGQITGREYRVRHADGTWHWIGTREMVFSRAADGTPKEIMGLAQDITERKGALEALQASEAKYRQLVSASSDPVFSFDARERYQFVNDAFARPFSKSPEMIIGSSPFDLFPAPEAEKRLQMVRQVFQTGERREIEVVVVTSTGETTHYMTLADPIKNAAGQVVVVSCISRNITDRKRAEQALHQVTDSLAAANRELQLALAREQKLARTDPLTGVGNRLSFYELAEHEFQVARRYERSLSILVLDIDDFKHINDAFGHSLGDRALRMIADTVQTQLRAADLLARFGGDEFVALLPDTDQVQTAPLVERIRGRVALLRVRPDADNIPMTVSIGIASRTPTDESIDSVIQRADQAMYAAKRGGGMASGIESGAG